MKERALMLPGFAGFALFYVLPFLITCFYAFVQSPFDTTFMGLDNILKTLQNAYFQMALRQTASFTLVSVSLTLMLCILLTFLISNSRTTFYAPFILPVLLPTVAVTLIWNVLFGRDSMISALGVSSRTALYALFVWKNTGLHVVFMLSAIAQLPRESVEAAAIDGAGVLRRFWHIILPQLLPTLLFSGVYAIMCSFRVFREAYLLYGAYPDESLFMAQHYIYNQFTKLHYPQVVSSGLVYAVPIILLVALIFRAESNTREENSAK